MYYPVDHITSQPLVGLWIYEQVVKQTAMHLWFPSEAPGIDLYHAAGFTFKVLHHIRGRTPRMLAKDYEPDEGLLSILLAYDSMKHWHKNEIFIGGISSDSIVLKHRLRDSVA